jgi:hypothetical protein
VAHDEGNHRGAEDKAINFRQKQGISRLNKQPLVSEERFAFI